MTVPAKYFPEPDKLILKFVLKLKDWEETLLKKKKKIGLLTVKICKFIGIKVSVVLAKGLKNQPMQQKRWPRYSLTYVWTWVVTKETIDYQGKNIF